MPARRAGICPRPRSTRRPSAGGEGLIAADGPARLPDRAAHRPVARTTSSSSASRRAKRSIAWGGVNRPIDPAHFEHAAARPARVARRHGAVRPGLLSPAPTRSTACRSASSPSTPGTACSRATCFIVDAGRRAAHAPAASRSSTRPSFKADPGAPRHAAPRSSIAAELRRAAGAHRRHELRRRDQEVGLHAS